MDEQAELRAEIIEYIRNTADVNILRGINVIISVLEAIREAARQSLSDQISR